MKVLLVTNETIARARLKRLLAARAGVHISEAATEYDALTSVRTESPALILLDLDPPGLGGLELLRRMLTEHPEARVLVLRMEPNTLDAARALRIGAAGYLSRNTSPEELMEAVRRVVGGGRYIEAGVAQALALKATEIGSPMKRLTERELKIISLLSDGQSLSNIASALGVSYNTVANTCRRIKAKLGLVRTADLVRLSIEKAVLWRDSMP